MSKQEVVRPSCEKTEMTTDKCASTIAEGKHGDFAEQNYDNALLGSYFPCLCAHLLRNDVDSQHHSAEPYRSIYTDIYACLSTSRLFNCKCTGKVIPFGSPFIQSYPIHGVTARDHTHTHTHAHTLLQLCSNITAFKSIHTLTMALL